MKIKQYVYPYGASIHDSTQIEHSTDSAAVRVYTDVSGEVWPIGTLEGFFIATSPLNSPQGENPVCPRMGMSTFAETHHGRFQKFAEE